jgi:Predicted phage phi-C31 gp36 major capsid-like protein
MMKRRSVTPAASLARWIDMPGSDVVHIPIFNELTDATVGIGEAAVATDDNSSPTDELQFTPLAIGCQVTLNKDFLRRSAGYPIEQILSDAIGRKHGYAIENQVLNGNTSSQFYGLFNSSGLSTSYDVATTLSIDGCKDLKAALPAEYWADASFIMNQETYCHLEKHKDTTGQYLWEPNSQVGGPPRLLGMPVFISSKCPHAISEGNYVVVLGAMSNYIIVQSMAFTLEVENKLSTNQYIWYSRVNLMGKPGFPDAFRRLKITLT